MSFKTNQTTPIVVGYSHLRGDYILCYIIYINYLLRNNSFRILLKNSGVTPMKDAICFWGKV